MSEEESAFSVRRRNLSLFSASIPGPEAFFAGRPLLVVHVVFLQIIVTLLLVGVLSRPTRGPTQ